MTQLGVPGGEQDCCPALQCRVNKAVLVTHAVSHERGLWMLTPAQGNIALREQQGTKERLVLAGHEGLPLPGCLQSPGVGTALWLNIRHWAYHTQPGVPAAQDHHLPGQAGLSSSAAL